MRPPPCLASPLLLHLCLLLSLCLLLPSSLQPCLLPSSVATFTFTPSAHLSVWACLSVCLTADILWSEMSQDWVCPQLSLLAVPLPASLPQSLRASLPITSV